MTEQERSKLETLLETEMTLAEIAREMGWSYHTFRIRVAEAGFQIRRVLAPNTKSQAQLTAPATVPA